MPMNSITMQDIRDYLATKGMDEVIGEAMNGYACLAHNVLCWKYGLEEEEVLALRTHATLYAWGVIDFPEDVERAVGVFDDMRMPGTLITKAEYMEEVGAL